MSDSPISKKYIASINCISRKEKVLLQSNDWISQFNAI